MLYGVSKDFLHDSVNVQVLVLGEIYKVLILSHFVLNKKDDFDPALFFQDVAEGNEGLVKTFVQVGWSKGVAGVPHIRSDFLAEGNRFFFF